MHMNIAVDDLRLFALRAFVSLLLIVLGGCANPLRKVEVQQPLTARPPMPVAAPQSDGAIYHAAAYRKRPSRCRGSRPCSGDRPGSRSR